MIELRPITTEKANQGIEAWHRHHKPIRVKVLGIGAFINDEMVGVAVVEYPKAPALSNHANGLCLEVTRLAITPDGDTRNVGSRLLGACWRAVKAMGCLRLVSYTRDDESGHTYLAAGWTKTAKVKGRHWNTGNKKQRWIPGLYESTTEIVDRARWEISKH